MSFEKQRKLVQLLRKKTDELKIDWRETSSVSKFQTSFSSSSIHLEEIDVDGEMDYQISILNENGLVVESFRDTDLDGVTPIKIWFRQMKELFEMARRTVSGSEKLLNDILFELDEDISF